MSGVRLISVAAEETDLRLDRWFRRHFPGVNHIRLEKLLRTGQVRVDGGRVKAAHRLEPGMTVRVPPLDESATIDPGPPSARPQRLKPYEIDALKARVLFRDKDVIAFDKPPGLAVQGGTKMNTHLDGMLDALTFDAKERPRLVHRLDKDTSGVLLLARSAESAAWLAQSFRDKTARKTYWALVAGVPRPHKGRIDLAIGKTAAGGRDKVVADEDEGKDARTYYAVVEQAAQKAAWVALMPLTGRTHQLRVHMAEIGTPIIGDGKYGGTKSIMTGLEGTRELHLHARSLAMRRPDGKLLSVEAPLPNHMARSWNFFGFSHEPEVDPFIELDLE